MVTMLIQDSERIKCTSLAKDLGRDLSALSKAAERIYHSIRKEESIKMRHEEVLDAIEKSTFQTLYYRIQFI